jgi:hypothetical protein
VDHHLSASLNKFDPDRAITLISVPAIDAKLPKALVLHFYLDTLTFGNQLCPQRLHNHLFSSGGMRIAAISHYALLQSRGLLGGMRSSDSVKTD